MKRLVDDLLDFGSIESGQLRLDVKPDPLPPGDQQRP